jgi:hypothetical protein
MPTLKELLGEWYDSTLPRLPRGPQPERFNSIPQSPLADEIRLFVRQWIVQHPPATPQEQGGYFDNESVLCLDEAYFAPEVTHARLMIGHDTVGWLALDEVRVTEGRVCYAKRREALDLRDTPLARSCVRWEVVA